MKIDRQYRTVQHHTIQSLRGFFSHLYAQGVIGVDLASRLPRDKFHRQPELPSVYTEKEINKMIAAIDRSTKVGKRSYAIVLLAARLGLRSSDIAGIKFTDIDWDNCVIRLNQFKTGKLLELPLSTEIGEYRQVSIQAIGNPVLIRCVIAWRESFCLRELHYPS